MVTDFCSKLLGQKLFDFLLALSFTAVTIGLLLPLAKRLGLLDEPRGHKGHERATPVVGGLAVGVVVLTWATLQVHEPLMTSFVLGFAGMLAVGVADDRLHLRAGNKLVLILLVAIVSLFPFDVYLRQLGDLLPWRSVGTGSYGPLLTLFATAAVINAFNMCDGLDGLAGGIAASALAWLWVVLGLGDTALALRVLPLVMLGAVLAFLVFNARWRADRPARVFMGDAGSLSLGFGLVWLTIVATQYGGQDAVAPVVMVWILAVPMLDMVAVMALRLKNRTSVMRAGRDHVHHLLLARGVPVSGVAALATALSFVLGGIGVGMWLAGVPDWISLGLFLLLCMVYVATFVWQWTRLNPPQAEGVEAASALGPYAPEIAGQDER